MSPLYSFEFSYTQRGSGLIEAESEEAAWDLIGERLDEFEARSDLSIDIEEV